jgi:hypothetical protein
MLREGLCTPEVILRMAY